MHKPRSKIDISKGKLTKHFKQHFAERVLEMPAELEHPKSFEYLKDIPIEVNEDPPILMRSKMQLKLSKIINLPVRTTRC